MKLSTKKLAAVVVLSGVMLVVFASVAVAGPPWSDASNSWWTTSYGVTETEVATVADGYPDGTFRPGLAVTRGQFAKMAVSGLGVETADPATATFKDVIKSNIFFIYVEGAYAAQLIGGYPSGADLLFKPGSNITRQQANSILGRYLSQLEIVITGAIHGDVTTYGTLDNWYKAEGSFYLKGYDDEAKVASSHRATTAYLIFRKIVKGSNSKLNPTATLIRAQAAALVLRVEAEAEEIKTPPGAPTNLAVTATGTGKTVTYNGTTQQYVGNDSTPQVTGDTLASRPIAIYDNGTKLVEDSSNSAGKFYTDLSAALSDGIHGFTAKVKNANGLVSAASPTATYVLDTVQPNGAVSKPLIPTGRTFASVGVAKPDFTATATDQPGSGVKQVEFQCSVKQVTPSWQSISVDTSPEPGTTTYTAVWPSVGPLGVGLTDGMYMFRVVITDNAGNERVSASTDVTVDTTKPTVNITAPVANANGIAYTEDSKPGFTATASDPAGAGLQASGIDYVQFFYAVWTEIGKPTTWSGFTEIYKDTAADYAATYPAAGLPEGRYIFAARAVDMVGNESALMNGTSYAAGATQEVIIDQTAPVLNITGPFPGETVEENKSNGLNITWVLVDVTAPDTVKIEYTLDASAAVPVWVPLETATPNDGSYLWTTPDISGDKVHAQLRITAIDKAGAFVGDVPGHTTVSLSGQFTIYDLPVAVTGLTGDDPDTVETGVDGRDFHATWTVSTSADIVSQKVYILPASESTLDLGSDQPVKTYPNNSAGEWFGDELRTTDSQGNPLVEGSYKIWIVVTDIGGRVVLAWSSAFAVEAE